MAKRKNKKKVGWQAQILLIGALLSSIVFSSVALLLAVGMIPTIVAAAVDRSKYRLRTWTVGAMNLAGCVPFLMELWLKGATFELALNYIANPRTIVVIYFAAAMGYIIDWAMTGLVASFMVQRGKSRQKEIEKQQKELVARWGIEVTGSVPLDEYGFAKEDITADNPESSASDKSH